MPTEAAFALWISQTTRSTFCTACRLYPWDIRRSNRRHQRPNARSLRRHSAAVPHPRNRQSGIPSGALSCPYRCPAPCGFIPVYRHYAISLCEISAYRCAAPSPPWVPAAIARCIPRPPACALRAQKSAPAVSAEAFCGLCSLPHPERAPQLHGSCVPSRTAVFQGTGAPAWTPAHRADCACQEGVRVRRRGIAPLRRFTARGMPRPYSVTVTSQVTVNVWPLTGSLTTAVITAVPAEIPVTTRWFIRLVVSARPSS